MDNFTEDVKTETFMDILKGDTKKSKIWRAILTIILTYGACFIIDTCVSYGNPNWWSFPTVILTVVGICVLWGWTIIKMKKK